MVIKNLCILVLWTKVASALERLNVFPTICFHLIDFIKIVRLFFDGCWRNIGLTLSISLYGYLWIFSFSYFHTLYNQISSLLLESTQWFDAVAFQPGPIFIHRFPPSLIPYAFDTPLARQPDFIHLSIFRGCRGQVFIFAWQETLFLATLSFPYIIVIVNSRPLSP